MVKNGNEKWKNTNVQSSASAFLKSLSFIHFYFYWFSRNPYHFCCDPNRFPYLQSHPAVIYSPHGREISHSRHGSGYSSHWLSLVACGGKCPNSLLQTRGCIVILHFSLNADKPPQPKGLWAAKWSGFCLHLHRQGTLHSLPLTLFCLPWLGLPFVSVAITFITLNSAECKSWKMLTGAVKKIGQRNLRNWWILNHTEVWTSYSKKKKEKEKSSFA